MVELAKPGTVLVVDDDDTVRDLIAEFLATEGYQALKAANGSEAVSVIGQLSPDVVILDLNMPGLDGYAVLDHLVEQGMSGVPVLVCTGRIPDSRLFSALSMGTRDFIAKPFGLEELALRVRRLGGASAMQQPGLIRVYSLGSMRVYRNDLLVLDESWRNRPGKAVLKLLFSRRGERLPAEMIGDLLWPDADPESTANRVRVAVHGVRKKLGYVTGLSAKESIIAQQEGLYFFNTTLPYWCDCSAFDEHIQRGHRASDQGDVDEALQNYAQADALCSGDYFRDDPYAEWLIPERERLREAHLAMLAEMARLFAVTGDHGEAIRICRRILASEPLREEVYRHLMRSLVALGRRHEALRAFEQCRRSLQSELGIEPATETVRLRDHLAAGEG